MGAKHSTRRLSPATSPSPSPPPSPVLNLQFRVLIIGRANAGKTSILQRVCDTTQSPEIYRSGPSGTCDRVQLDPTIERGHHNIEDELIFTNHDGYVFHDSRGFEAGSEDELKTVQEFVTRKSREKRLKDRLHAIWYCIPMDNDRPSLDLKYFADICPDKNVPVIAVFTKHDQFKRNIKIKLKDEGRDPGTDFDTEVETVFNKNFLANLSGHPPFVCLEGMHKPNQHCTNLIEMTANALSGGVVALMLMAVQRDNRELSIKLAIQWTHRFLERGTRSTETIMKICMMAFPTIWFFEPEEEEIFLERQEQFKELKECEEFEELLEIGFERGKFKFMFDKLTTFYSDPRLHTSRNHTTHTMIASVLILEYACILFISPSHPTREEALDEACSRFISSNTHNAVNRLFLLSPKLNSDQQFTEFALMHRLR